ncbi:MAG: FIST C-terminal domain-containing protein [Rhodospirillaceae bacterium]|nr:FIST C-terminal domain-containing protein [Rhodospirillaceae bacterium]
MTDRLAEAGTPGPQGFAAAIAADDHWKTAVDDCLARLGPTDGATLGFAYWTAPLAPHAGDVLERLRRVTGVQRWVGSTGIGICGNDREVFEQPALAVMVGRLAPESFRLFGGYQGAAANGGLDPGTARWVRDHAPTLALVHADPRNPRLPVIIDGLAEETGAFLVGGLGSGDDDIHQFAGDQVAAGGISGVLFDPAMATMTGLSQGCTPIGPTHTVTAGEQNIVIELDGRPAVDVLKEDVGELLARDLRRIGGYIFVAMPVAGSDTGDYLVRNLIGIDPGNGLIAIGDVVEPGDSLVFTRRDHASAVQDLDRMLQGVSRRLAGRRARAAVYVSCVARGPNLFGPNSEEIRQIRASLGDIPLVGFFASGEISHNRLYGYTGVLTVFA